MAYCKWNIGLEIYDGGIRAAGLSRQRSGWRLCRWWHIPFSRSAAAFGSDEFNEQLTTLLLNWRKTLPLRYQLRVSFPSSRTLQQQLPVPDCRLREAQYQYYVEQAAMQHLPFAPGEVCWDYPDEYADSPYLSVTGARQSDVDLLMSCLQNSQLQAQSITPDACALLSFSLSLDPAHQWLVHREPQYWLWAGKGQWGFNMDHSLPDLASLCREKNWPESQVAFSSVLSSDASAVNFSPLQAIHYFSPPLPECLTEFTVATGLALGEVRI